MRSTVRIDDDLLEALKANAAREKVSLTRLLNRTLRAGLKSVDERDPRRPFSEEPHAMGAPVTELDKALALAAQLEDAEIATKLALRK